MTEEGKKHFNLYKFLCFPWGVFCITPVWYGIVKVVDSFLSHVSITGYDGVISTMPWWISWLLFVIGLVAIILFSAIYTFTLPRGKKRGHNIYVLISPEYFSDDKYIISDFVDSFERHARGSIDDLNIIVPAAIKREAFNQRIERYKRKHKNYWESNRWNRLHKKLKGSLYFSGTLKRRSSQGKEKYVFLLSATVGYNNVNKEITPLMIDELQKNFPQTILINKELELEEFETVSDRFATFSEYLIGWAHLVSGHIGIAYKMHYDVFSNNKQSFFQRGALTDLKQLLRIEQDSILREGKLFPYDFVVKCIDDVNRMFPNSDTSSLLVARFLIMTSNDETFDANLSRAQALLDKPSISKENRDALHANRAYISLLKGDYSKAESEYRLLFKKTTPQLIENIITYCDGQIKDGCSKERPTAYYVKALMLSHVKDKSIELANALSQAKKNITSENRYYLEKLDEMKLQNQKRKKKEQH